MTDKPLPEAEADQRRDDGLRRMLTTPPKPHKALKKAKTATQGDKAPQ